MERQRTSLSCLSPRPEYAHAPAAASVSPHHPKQSHRCLALVLDPEHHPSPRGARIRSGINTNVVRVSRLNRACYPRELSAERAHNRLVVFDFDDVTFRKISTPY